MSTHELLIWVVLRIFWQNSLNVVERSLVKKGVPVHILGTICVTNSESWIGSVHVRIGNGIVFIERKEGEEKKKESCILRLISWVSFYMQFNINENALLNICVFIHWNERDKICFSKFVKIQILCHCEC